MKRRNKISLLLALLLGVVTATLAWAGLPGELPGISSEEVSIPDPGHPPLAARIWYAQQGLDAERRPLIIISHGTGGSSSAHSDTAGALAAAGFVVIAIQHTGDNFRDLSNVGRGTHLTERPRHISRAIDFMLRRWAHRAGIDPDRIGMFGHSAGGFTALVIAGANPDLSRRNAHCHERPQAWDCEYLRRNGYPTQSLGSQRAFVWHHDPRVKAIVAAAPPMGYSFDTANTADVTLPVQLWAANQDVIVDDSPNLIRRTLPVPPDYRVLPNASHFSFLMPCNVTMSAVIKVLQLFGTEAVCTDPVGFNRSQFHQEFNATLTQFFRRRLTATRL